MKLSLVTWTLCVDCPQGSSVATMPWPTHLLSLWDEGKRMATHTPHQHSALFIIEPRLSYDGGQH